MLIAVLLCASSVGANANAPQGWKADQANFKAYMEELDFATGGGEKTLVRGARRVKWKRQPFSPYAPIEPMWLTKGLKCERAEAARREDGGAFAPTSRQFHACCIVDKTLNGIEVLRNLRTCASYRGPKREAQPKNKAWVWKTGGALPECFPQAVVLWLRGIASCCCGPAVGAPSTVPGQAPKPQGHFYDDEDGHTHMQCQRQYAIREGGTKGESKACEREMAPVLVHAKKLARLFSRCADRDYFAATDPTHRDKHHMKACAKADEGLLRMMDHVLGAAKVMYGLFLPRGPKPVRDFLALCGGLDAVKGDVADSATALHVGPDPRCEHEIDRFVTHQLSWGREEADMDVAEEGVPQMPESLPTEPRKGLRSFRNVRNGYFDTAARSVPLRARQDEGDDDWMDDDATMGRMGKNPSQYAKNCAPKLEQFCLTTTIYTEVSCHRCAKHHSQALLNARCHERDIHEFCQAVTARSKRLRAYERRHEHDQQTIGLEARPAFGATVQTACSAADHLYQDDAKQSMCKACAACPSGQVRTGCGASSPGTCEHCDVGHKKISAFVCVACPEGTFEVGNMHCKACSAGRHSEAGATGCTSCKGGFYKPAAGKGGCMRCSGSWVHTAGPALAHRANAAGHIGCTAPVPTPGPVATPTKHPVPLPAPHKKIKLCRRRKCKRCTRRRCQLETVFKCSTKACYKKCDQAGGKMLFSPDGGTDRCRKGRICKSKIYKCKCTPYHMMKCHVPHTRRRRSRR